MLCRSLPTVYSESRLYRHVTTNNISSRQQDEITMSSPDIHSKIMKRRGYLLKVLVLVLVAAMLLTIATTIVTAHNITDKQDKETPAKPEQKNMFESSMDLLYVLSKKYLSRVPSTSRQ